MSVGTTGEVKNMTRLAQGRKTPIVDPVNVGVRVEKSTRDDAKSLGLNQSKILREALEQAVEAEMRKHNYQHPEEIPQVEQSSWLGFFKWW
jgi:post-segregation antitoxin (ccd killing protein)